MIHTPHVDWFAISTILVLLGASFVALLGAVLVPDRHARAFAATVSSLGFAGGLVTSIWLYVDERRRPSRRLGRLLPRPLDDALADHPLRDRPRDHARRRRADRARARRAHLRVLLASARVDGRHGVLRRLREPDGDVPRARVVLDRALRHVRDRLRRRGLARGRAEVPDHRLVRLGGAALRVGARLRRYRAHRLRARSRSRRRAGPRGRRAARARPRDDHRRPRLQVFGGAVPHVDARRLRGRADDGDGVHVGGDEGRGVRARLPRVADGVPAGAAPLELGVRRASPSRRSRSGTSRRSCSGT